MGCDGFSGFGLVGRGEINKMLTMRTNVCSEEAIIDIDIMKKFQS